MFQNINPKFSFPLNNLRNEPKGEKATSVKIIITIENK